MKKTNRIISIVLCFAMLISAFSMLASAADIETAVENQSFENLTVGEAPNVDGWNTANTGDGAQTAIGTTETYPNLAMNLKHCYSSASNLTATHSFETATSAEFCFDYKYESMSLTTGKGGSYMGLAMDGANKFVVYVQKNSSDGSNDDTGFLGYFNGSAWVKTEFNEFVKNEWYNIALKAYANPDGSAGSKFEIKVTHNNEIVFEQTYSSTATAEVNQIYFSNRTWDNNDSHWFDNINLTADSYTYSENFESYAVNKTIASDLWVLSCAQSWAVDTDTANVRVQKSPITKQVTEETTYQNRAMNVKHAYSSVSNLTATHSFETATSAVLSFDYKYTSMSPTKGGGGGASLFLAKDGTDKFGIKIYKTATDQANGTDELGEVYYNVESSSTKSGFANLVKGEWYHFDLKISPDANGSKLELKISYDGAVICEKTITTSTALEVNQIYFSNRSWDPDDSHWIDNISLAAGDYSFNEDFEDYELNKTVASDVWVLSCAQAWAVDRDDVNVRVQDASYATRAPQLSNKALNINHTYMHSNAINSVYVIDSTSKATLSFDYLYDGISPHYNGAKGGARLGFSADGTFVYGLYVSKIDESWTEDVADYDKNAKLSYYDGSKYVDTGFNALTKGEWYNFTLELNGAKATVTVKQDAKILFTATYDNAVAKAVNQIY